MRPRESQLRYNRGYRVRQEGISAKILQPSRAFIRIRFPIEVNTAQDLRLVNLGFGRSLDLRSLTLKPLAGPTRSLTAAELSPNTPDRTNTQISQIDEVIHVESNGTDPLVLRLERGSRLQASRTALLLQWIFLVPLAGAALALVCGFRQSDNFALGVPPACPDKAFGRTSTKLTQSSHNDVKANQARLPQITFKELRRNTPRWRIH